MLMVEAESLRLGAGNDLELYGTHSGWTTGIGRAKLGPQFWWVRDGPRTHGFFFGVESALIHVFLSNIFLCNDI